MANTPSHQGASAYPRKGAYKHPIEASDALGPSMPPAALLGEFAPLSIWEAAWRSARQGAEARFRMGSVIFKEGQIVAGHSQLCVDRRLVEDNASLHAERHALLRASHLDLSGSVCVVVGINKRDTGCPWSCCPCMSCARSLYNRGIESVIYPQRRCDGKWMVRMETPSSLLQRTPALQGDIDISPLGLFARQNQLAVVA